MERGLYIAASGMVAELARQDQIANELANASTPGYKPDRNSQHAFSELLVKNVHGAEVGKISTGAMIAEQTTDLRAQPLRDTGEPTDFAIEGEGFFAVQTAEGVRYTRNGAFAIAADRTLTDQLGNRVLGQNGQPVRAGADGAIAADALGVFALTGARKVGEANFTGTAAGRGAGTVRASALETSGVDAARTMIDMMASLRAFEAGQKVITTIDETLDRAASQVASSTGR